ncbi:MAG: glycosyltransferase family 2 protein [Verrucomicrobia bacterium]|nr:glycosyltransferase family 2 protein [Kiritimatiellia bacterium]MCP5488039.1 glycosyltransferase family 2 protein [Verrucomicrobiota bacterium]
MSETSSIQLSIIIPCLNEKATLAAAINLARQAIEQSGLSGEVVVSDNGSTDGSQAIAEREGARVVQAPRKGYGYALLEGFKQAKGEYLVMGDADATYDFREAVAFIEHLKNGADFVIGSRLAGNIHPGAMPFLHRYLGTPVLSFLINLFFGLRITDCNCGMRALTRKAFDRLGLISGGMEFASEMIIKAGLYNLKVKEVPCSLHKDTRDKEPHLRTWRDGWRHLRFILLFAPHVVFTIPGWIFFVLGMGMTIPVLSGPFSIAGRIIDYHYLFYSIPLLFIGYQALWFAQIEDHFVKFAGFLPADMKSREEGGFQLERWLILGGALSVGGGGVLIGIFWRWVATGFGPMAGIRPGATAMVLIILGVLTILNAMIISMMDTKVDRR